MSGLVVKKILMMGPIPGRKQKFFTQTHSLVSINLTDLPRFLRIRLRLSSETNFNAIDIYAKNRGVADTTTHVP